MWLFLSFVLCFLLKVLSMFFLLNPLLFLLIGGGLRPLLQCHISDQDWIGQTAVFSEPCHGGVSCAADPGLWGPGSYGHGGLLHFPGGSCRPGRGHAPRASYRHGPHHGKSPRIVSPPQAPSGLFSFHLSSLSLRSCSTGEYMWWLICRLLQQ